MAGISKDLLALHSRIVFPEPSTGTRAGKQAVSAFNAEIAVLGHAFDSRSLEALEFLSPESLEDFRSSLLPVLSEATGSDVDHRALFRRFPYETPDDRDYLIRQIVLTSAENPVLQGREEGVAGI